MRLLRSILTLITFIVTLAIVVFSEYATLAIITLPGKLPGSNANVVDRVLLVPDLTDNTKISYVDSIEFWSVDIKESIDIAINEPEFAVRGWFEWHWWENGMKWADIAYSTVKAVVVPVFAPVYEVKEMYVYYGRDLYDPIFAEQFNQEFGNNVVYSGTVDDYLIHNMTDISQNQFQFIYNVQRKLAKYNSEIDGVKVYEKFVKKFVNYSGTLENGVRGLDYEFESVNALSAFLFYQIFLAFILSIYFTYQNPIVIKKNAIGENEVQGRFFPRIPRVGFGKRPKRIRKSKKEEIED